MIHCVRVLAAMAIVVLCQTGQAESLRCAGGIAAEGDSRVAVAFKCGPPLLQDSFCAPVYFGQTLHPVPEPFASAFVPCQRTDEWLYDRGPGNLVATVRFRWGVVQSIRYGRDPQ
ncbi:MAG TPA: DUF2845 domain-containing protein [Rhodanobacter sp.]